MKLIKFAVNKLVRDKIVERGAKQAILNAGNSSAVRLKESRKSDNLSS